MTEGERERDKRRAQRALFDGVAGRYKVSRPGYPDGVVEFVLRTAGVGPGSAVLEIGCGTGQLTASLATFGFRLTAIDIGPSMVAAARQRLADTGAEFIVTSFEELDAADLSFDLVISGAAFHWIDPETRFSKTARLLRPGGWLAVVNAADEYDAPVGPVLRGLWAAQVGAGDVWLNTIVDSDVIARTGLFEPAVSYAETQRLTEAAGVVFDVERTRATYLSWPDHVRQAFDTSLRRALGDQADIGLTRKTSVTMARAGKPLGAMSSLR